MRRRALLQSAAGLAAAVGLAGCFMGRPPAELRLRPATPELLDEQLATAPRDYPEEQGRLVDELLDEGAVVETAAGEPTLPDGEYVRDGSRYHAIRTTFVGDVRREGYELIVRRPPEETVADEPVPVETVAFDALPATDRSAFLAAEPSAMEPGIGRYLFLAPDEFDPDESTFASADGPVAVEYEGTSYRVEYRGEEIRDDRRYRYEVETVLGSRSAFVSHVTDRYRFEIDRAALSDAARDVLDEAIVESADEDGYTEELGYGDDAGVSEPLGEVLDLLSEHDAPGRTHSGQGEWLCAYDGTDYWAEVGYAPDGVTDQNDYLTPTGDRGATDPTEQPASTPTDRPTTDPGGTATGTTDPVTDRTATTRTDD